MKEIYYLRESFYVFRFKIDSLQLTVPNKIIIIKNCSKFSMIFQIYFIFYKCFNTCRQGLQRICFSTCILLRNNRTIYVRYKRPSFCMSFYENVLRFQFNSRDFTLRLTAIAICVLLTSIQTRADIGGTDVAKL